jgi:hypothetical protein
VKNVIKTIKEIGDELKNKDFDIFYDENVIDSIIDMSQIGMLMVRFGPSGPWSGPRTGPRPDHIGLNQTELDH